MQVITIFQCWQQLIFYRSHCVKVDVGVHHVAPAISLATITFNLLLKVGN
jgi:hypothetical protein